MANTLPFAWYAPDAFVGKQQILSAYEPYPVLTASQFSSVAPASAAFIHWNQPDPIAIKNVVVQGTLAAGVPGATSQASAGSQAWTYALSAFLYSRSDYGANSTVLAPVASGSFGLTATLTYTSSSQLFGFSWVTDTAGGTSNITTTSNDAAWSNSFSGVKQLSIPFSTIIPPGEYWMGFQHSSSTTTSNSNVTLGTMSMLQIVGQQASISAGVLGGTNTSASIFFNAGLLNATPTFSTTMPISSISIGGRPIWFAMSNA